MFQRLFVVCFITTLMVQGFLGSGMKHLEEINANVHGTVSR